MKRVLAWIGIIILAIMYITAFVCSIIGTPFAFVLCMVCIVSTIAIPIIIHFLLIMMNMKNGGSMLDDPYHTKKDEHDTDR